jgi:ABC-type phosphate transport system substrate-binding protein
MRKLIQIAASTAVVVSTTVLAMGGIGTALADPPGGVTPKETDVVGVGSDTTEYLADQLAFDYNKSHSTGPKLYSWDATNPQTGAIGDSITTKAGCTAIPRPDGGSAGIMALEANAKTADGKHFCIDYVNNTRPRASTDPAKAPGGIVFVTIGKDAISYATNATTNAPGNLTTAQLNAIYTCTATTWTAVGGSSSATIQAFLPQSGSGLRSAFLKDIGVSTPGACTNSSVQQNEGVDPQFASNPNAIVPYSVGKYIAQVFHSAKCLNASCTGSPACKPTKAQNRFGCDAHGNFVLHQINGSKPTVGTGTNTLINPKYTPKFLLALSVVVRWANTPDNIPKYLDRFFGSASRHGWICSSTTAAQDIHNYGDLTTPFCGTGS